MSLGSHGSEASNHGHGQDTTADTHSFTDHMRVPFDIVSACEVGKHPAMRPPYAQDSKLLCCRHWDLKEEGHGVPGAFICRWKAFCSRGARSVTDDGFRTRAGTSDLKPVKSSSSAMSDHALTSGRDCRMSSLVSGQGCPTTLPDTHARQILVLPPVAQIDSLTTHPSSVSEQDLGQRSKGSSEAGDVRDVAADISQPKLCSQQRLSFPIGTPPRHSPSSHSQSTQDTSRLGPRWEQESSAQEAQHVVCAALSDHLRRTWVEKLVLVNGRGANTPTATEAKRAMLMVIFSVIDRFSDQHRDIELGVRSAGFDGVWKVFEHADMCLKPQYKVLFMKSGFVVDGILRASMLKVSKASAHWADRSLELSPSGCCLRVVRKSGHIVQYQMVLPVP